MRPQFARRRHRASITLEAIGAAYPHAWQTLEELRAHRAEWPGWCYVPIDRVREIVGDAAPVVACLGAWRMTQGIYRLEGLARGADPPALPEWCVYVDPLGWLWRDPSGWHALDDALEIASFDPAGDSAHAAAVHTIAAGQIVGKGEPGNPRPVRSSGAWRLYPARGPRFWRVTGADHA